MGGLPWENESAFPAQSLGLYQLSFSALVELSASSPYFPVGLNLSCCFSFFSEQLPITAHSFLVYNAFLATCSLFLDDSPCPASLGRGGGVSEGRGACRLKHANAK